MTSSEPTGAVSEIRVLRTDGESYMIEIGDKNTPMVLPDPNFRIDSIFYCGDGIAVVTVGADKPEKYVIRNVLEAGPFLPVEPTHAPSDGVSCEGRPR